MDWDRYRVFLAVVEHKTFSAAARALRSSQPTVGRTIAALEEELGAKVFARTPTGLVPTPEGERIVEDARRMSDAAASAIRRVEGVASGLDGVVRIATTEGIGALWLTRRLATLRDAHKALRFELVIANTAVDLARREADVAVRLFRPSDPDLVIRRVGRIRFGLFASPSYVRERGMPRRLADLARHDLIGFPVDNRRIAIARWLHRLAPDERFVLLTASLLAQHEAARAGLGIALGTEVLLAEDPALRRVLPRARPPAPEIYLAAHADMRRSPRVAAVYDALTKLFATSPLRD